MCRALSTGSDTCTAPKVMAMINKSNTSHYGNITKERLRVINSGLGDWGKLDGDDACELVLNGQKDGLDFNIHKKIVSGRHSPGKGLELCWCC